MNTNRIWKIFILLFLVWSVTVSIGAAKAPLKTANPFPGDTGNLSLSPGPQTIDRVTHNRGNIITTVDNFGYIGGYSYYDLPSGEWPKNSGHDYIAEILYWVGATLPNGDTVVANTYDDFQAIQMPVNGTDEYQIYLSTDTNRFYDYDASDTVGLGDNRPAYGWRVWNSSTDSWEYNQKYSVLATGYQDGGPTSQQDSYYRFNDAALGTPLLGLEFTHTIYQWDFCYNEDFMFVLLNIENKSTNDYTDLAFGIYVDLDVGGPDGTGENGRLRDAVVYDTAAGWAYIYDVDGEDPGWNDKTGIMGTKFLETPGGNGMTAFRTDDWANLPDEDISRFELINSSQFDTPLAPTDQFYIQCTRGINLPAGSSVQVVYAIIAGADSTEFVENSEAVQTLYNANFVGPEPPKAPSLQVRAGDERVYLAWTDSSEASVDPLSSDNDFAGYKLYRSDDLGKTWGTINPDNENQCLDEDYYPLFDYPMTNPGDPMPHTYIDTGLYNGVEYWYSLVAYDTGDSVAGDVLQNGFGIPGTSPNVLKVTPRTNPAGFVEAASTVVHEYNGTLEPSEGIVYPTVFDATEMIDGDYEVTFADSSDATYWYLVNITTDDTLLANQTLTNAADPGLFDVAAGLRVVIEDADFIPPSMEQTSGSSTMEIGDWYGVAMNNFFGSGMEFSHERFRSTYELRYTTDSSLAAWALDGYYGSDYPVMVPFEAWNTTTNERVSLAIYELYVTNDTWDPWDLLVIVDYPYDSTQSVANASFPYDYGWMFAFDELTYNPQAGDVITLEGAALNSPNDVFKFTVDAISSSLASGELRDVKVVPNPYFVNYEPMVERTRSLNTAIQFINLPNKCSIRIYTLSGDLVQTIDHDTDGGTAEWNLLTANSHQIASGIYLYHVESEYGQFLGRFSVIK